MRILLTKQPAALQTIDDNGDLPLHVDCRFSALPAELRSFHHFLVNKFLPQLAVTSNKNKVLPLHVFLVAATANPSLDSSRVSVGCLSCGNDDRQRLVCLLLCCVRRWQTKKKKTTTTMTMTQTIQHCKCQFASSESTYVLLAEYSEWVTLSGGRLFVLGKRRGG